MEDVTAPSLNGCNEVIDISEDKHPAVFDVFAQSLRKTPRKKVAVEKYTDQSYLTKKSKAPKSKTPSEKNKPKSSGKKRMGSLVTSTKTTTTLVDDGTSVTTQITTDPKQRKIITTTTTTALDGTETVTTEEAELPPPTKKQKAASSVYERLLHGKKESFMEVELTEADIAAQVASIPSLEEKERQERDHLAGMRRMKAKLEKAIETEAKITFPIEDTRIAAVDKKGNPPSDLPPAVQKLVHVPDLLVGDVLYVWDFLTIFSKELNLTPLSVDDFVDLLHYRGAASPALVEVFVSLLRRVWGDQYLGHCISSALPSHLHVLSRASEEEAEGELRESQLLQQYRDWAYNGLKLIPKRSHGHSRMSGGGAEVVDAIKFQCLLRVALPRLPSYLELLRATDPQLDALISMENREGVDKDGHQGLNRDTLRSLTANFSEELRRLNEALRSLEKRELHQLSLSHKVLLLTHLCRACYDTSHVQNVLILNQEERANQLSQLSKRKLEEAKKQRSVSPELREEALLACRAVNGRRAASLLLKQPKDEERVTAGKGKGKGSAAKPSSSTKHPHDPSGPQLAAMVEDLKLQRAIKIDVVLENEMGLVADPSEDISSSRGSSKSAAVTARSGLAELERKRKEREKSALIKTDAVVWLEQALETGRDKDIRDALKYGRQAELEGRLESGDMFCTPLMFKVYRKRAQLEAASREARLAAEHERAIAGHFLRTEPIGYDRHHRAYWCFEGDTRVFVQTTVTPGYFDRDGGEGCLHESVSTPSRPSQPAPAGGGILLLSGETTKPMPATPSALSPAPGGSYTLRSNAQLYASKPSNVQHTWRVYGSMLEIWMLVESLDERGVREKELKGKLKAQFGMMEGGGGEVYRASGSEYIGKKIRRTFGKKVAYGTIVGWLPAEGNDEALWHVVHDDGDEEDLDLLEVEMCFASEAAERDEKDSSEGGGKRKSTSGLETNQASALDSDSDSGSGSDNHIEVPDVVSTYMNSVSGGLGVTSKQVGLPGLRAEMLHYESMLLEGLKHKGSAFNREGKRQWEHAVKSADSLGELRACVVSLEEVVHDTQLEEDEIDSMDTKNKKEVMLTDGWIFDSLDSVLREKRKNEMSESEVEEGSKGSAGAQSSSIPVSEGTVRQYQQLELAAAAAEKERAMFATELEGEGGGSKQKQGMLARKKKDAEEASHDLAEFKEGLTHLQSRVRRFFEGHGASDGVIVAYLPARLNEGSRLWHLEHDDGDTEDLDLGQLLRGERYFETNAQEADEDDEDDDESENDEDSHDTDRDANDSESEDDDEMGEQQAKLWPSLNVRTRWIHATNVSVTIAEVSLALMCLMTCARSYGVVGEDPLAGAQGNRKSKQTAHHSRTSSVSSSTTGKRKRSDGGSGAGRKNSGKGKKAARSSSRKQGRTSRSLMDRAAKRCVATYSED